MLLWISIPLVNVKTLPDTVWFSEKRWWCLSMVSYLHFKFLDSKDIKIGVFPIIATATKSFVLDKGFVRGAAGLKTIFFLIWLQRCYALQFLTGDTDSVQHIVKYNRIFSAFSLRVFLFQERLIVWHGTWAFSRQL